MMTNINEIWVTYFDGEEYYDTFKGDKLPYVTNLFQSEPEIWKIEINDCNGKYFQYTIDDIQ